LSLESVFESRLFQPGVSICDASYSIYLFHPLVSYGFDLVWPLRVALAMGTGISVYLVVERRIMAARKRKSDAYVTASELSPAVGET